MANDFVDRDLLRPLPPQDAPTRTVDGGSTHERLKRRVEDGESHASDELERMRKRSEEIERQRQALRSLRGKQAEFDRTHREMVERLKRHVVLLKGEEEQASRAATVCHETRHRFEALQEELARIDPESWSEATLEADLTQSLAQIESARAVFRKGVDRVAAIGWHPDEARVPQNDALLADAGASSRRFVDWFKIGVALTLPLAILLVLLLVGYWAVAHAAAVPGVR